MFKAFGFVATMHQESRFHVDFMCHMKSCMSCGSPNLDTVSRSSFHSSFSSVSLSLSVCCCIGIFTGAANYFLSLLSSKIAPFVLLLCLSISL